jgi:hypothetical protein
MPYDVDIGDGADALGQNQLSDALDGTYWVSGWDATLGTGDLEVDIAFGEGAIDGTDVSTGSTQTIDFTGDPDSTDPRKAVIYVDSGGTVQKSLGTPQPVDPTGEIRFRTWNPSPPASVAGVVIAEVWLEAGATKLVSDDVRDRRLSNTAAANATPNEPDWAELPNSPISSQNTDNITYNISTNFDIYKIFVKIQDQSEAGAVDLRVNNDTGDNYTTFDVVGNEDTDSGWISLSLIETDETSTASFMLYEGSAATRLQNLSGVSREFDLTEGFNDNVSGNLTQFTLIRQISGVNNSRPADWTVEVYGKNI